MSSLKLPRLPVIEGVVAAPSTARSAGGANVELGLRNHIEFSVGKIEGESLTDVLDYASCWRVCVLSIRDRLIELANQQQQLLNRTDAKRCHLLLPEFSGCSLMRQTLINLDVEVQYKHALSKIGFDLDQIYRQEKDFAFGYSGLSRLMPDILESISTCQYPVFCYAIRFNYGIFRQKIVNGWQSEFPDYYLIEDNPYEVHRHDVTYKVKFGGTLVEHPRHHGLPLASPRSPANNTLPIWQAESAVDAVAYDILFSGYRTLNCSRVRLWRSIPARTEQGSSKPCGDFLAAVRDKQEAESLTAVLYPADLPEMRLKQTYFFVSASVQDALSIFLSTRRKRMRSLGPSAPSIDWPSLPEKMALQCMDPGQLALCFPELVRLLVFEHRLPWHTAVSLSQQCFHVTFHDLQSWQADLCPVPLLEKLLPCHLRIINDFNLQFLDRVRVLWGDIPAHIRSMTVYQDNPLPKHIRWAHLSVVAARRVNATSALHLRHLVANAFGYYHSWFAQPDERTSAVDRISPLVHMTSSASMKGAESPCLRPPQGTNNKFLSISLGVSPRRWLLAINPMLSHLITAALGSQSWVQDLSLISNLNVTDSRFSSDWQCIKHRNKQRMFDVLHDVQSCPHLSTRSLSSGNSVPSVCLCRDPDAMCDVYVTSVSDAKRQLLNAFYMVHHYLKVKAHLVTGQPRRFPRRVSFMGGKAAPNDARSKLVIKLIDSIANVINSDTSVNTLYRVQFLNDAERFLPVLVPAADLCLQLALPGCEPLSAGPIRFLLNGALLLAALDPGTVELLEPTHRDIAFVFGLSESAQMEAVRRKPGPLDPRLQTVLEFVKSGALAGSDEDTQQMFTTLVDNLVGERGDAYLVCHDFASFVESQEHAETMFLEDPLSWTRLSIRSAASMSHFSSDRMVKEYAETVWELEPCQPLDRGFSSAVAGLVHDSITAITTPRVRTPRPPDCIFPRLAYLEDQDVLVYIQDSPSSMLGEVWEELQDRLDHIDWLRLIRVSRDQVRSEGTGAGNAFVFVCANSQLPRLFTGQMSSDAVLFFLSENVTRAPFVPSGRKLSRIVGDSGDDNFVYLRGSDNLAVDEAWIDLTDRLSESARLLMRVVDRQECKVNYDAVPPSGTAFLLVPAGPKAPIVLLSIDDVDEVVNIISRHARHTIRVQPPLLSRAIFNTRLENVDVLICTNPHVDSEVDDVWDEIHERILPETVRVKTMTYDLHLRKSDVLRIQSGPGFFLKVAHDNSIDVFEGPMDTDAVMVWLESRLSRSLMDLGKPFHRVAFRTGVDVVLQITDPEAARDTEFLELWDELQERLEGNQALRFFEWTRPVDHAGFDDRTRRTAVFLTRKNSPNSTSIEQFSGPLDIDAMIDWVCSVHGKQLQVKPRSLSRHVFRTDRDVFIMIFRDDSKECQSLVGVWGELLQRTLDSPHLLLTEFEGYLNKPDVPGFDYAGEFPTLYLVPAHSSGPVKYLGVRDADAIMDFLKERAVFPVIDSGRPLSRLLLNDSKVVLLLVTNEGPPPVELEDRAPMISPLLSPATDSLSGVDTFDTPPATPREVVPVPAFWEQTRARFAQTSPDSLVCVEFDLVRDKLRNDLAADLIRAPGIYLSAPSPVNPNRETNVLTSIDGSRVYKFCPLDQARLTDSNTIVGWAVTLCPNALAETMRSLHHLLATYAQQTIYVRIHGPSMPRNDIWDEIRERLSDSQVLALTFDGCVDIAFPHNERAGLVFFRVFSDPALHVYTGGSNDANAHLAFITNTAHRAGIDVSVRAQKFSRLASDEKDVVVYVVSSAGRGDVPGIGRWVWDETEWRCRLSERVQFRLFDIQTERLDSPDLRELMAETRNAPQLVIIPAGSATPLVFEPPIDEEVLSTETDDVIRELGQVCVHPVKDTGKSLAHMIASEERHILLRLWRGVGKLLPPTPRQMSAVTTSASTSPSVDSTVTEEEEAEWCDARERLEAPNDHVLRVMDFDVTTSDVNVPFFAAAANTRLPRYFLLPNVVGATLGDSVHPEGALKVPELRKHPIEYVHDSSDLGHLTSQRLLSFVQSNLEAELRLLPPRLSRLLFHRSKDVMLHLHTIKEEADEDLEEDEFGEVFQEVQERVQSDTLLFVDYDRNSRFMDVPSLNLPAPRPSIFVVSAGSQETRPFVPASKDLDLADQAVELLKAVATSPVLDLGKPLSRLLGSVKTDVLLRVDGRPSRLPGEWEETIWRLSGHADQVQCRVFDCKSGHLNLPNFAPDMIYYCRRCSSEGLLLPVHTPELGMSSLAATADTIIAYVSAFLPKLVVKPRPLVRLAWPARTPVLMRISELKKKSSSRMVGDKAWSQVVERIGHSDIIIENVRGPLSPRMYSETDRELFPYTAAPSLFLALPDLPTPFEYDSVWNANSIIKWVISHLPTIDDLGLRVSDLLDECSDSDVFLRLSDTTTVGTPKESAELFAELGEWEEVEERLGHSEGLRLINFNVGMGRLDAPGIKMDDTMRSTMWLLRQKGSPPLPYSGARTANAMIAFLEENCSVKLVAKAKPLARLIFRGDRDVLVKVDCPKSEAALNFLPIWEEVGERTNQSLRLDLVEFDCTTELPNVMGVERSIAPRLYLVTAKSDRVIPYLGDKAVEAIIHFVQTHCVHHVVATGRPFSRVLFQKDRDVFVRVFESGTSSSGSLRTSWGAGEAENTVWNEVFDRTVDNSKKVCITSFDGAETRAKVDGFEVGELPAFIFSRAGARMPIAYIGDHCAESMLAFLREYSSFPLKIAPRSFKAVISQAGMDVLVQVMKPGDPACDRFKPVWEEVVERTQMSRQLVVATYDCSEVPPNVPSVSSSNLPRVYLATHAGECLAEMEPHYLDADLILSFVAKHSQFEISTTSRSFSRTAFQVDRDVVIHVVRGSRPSPYRAIWNELMNRAAISEHLELCEFDCELQFPDVDGVEPIGIYLAPAAVRTFVKFEGEETADSLIRFLQTFSKFPVQVAGSPLMRAVPVSVSAHDEASSQPEPVDDEESSMYSEMDTDRVDTDHEDTEDDTAPKAPLVEKRKNQFVSAQSSPATTAREVEFGSQEEP